MRALREYARSVSKSISNWSFELPKYLSKGFLKFIINDHMLVKAKVGRGQLRECGDGKVRVLIPIGRRGVWLL